MSGGDSLDSTEAPTPISTTIRTLLDTPKRLLESARPGPLYHYTDQRGFLGILDRRRLWATSIRYLNDSQEYQVGLTRIAEEINARADKHPELKALLLESLDLASASTATVGVVSFSEVRDDLGQWRAYGGGSGGYSLGFDGLQMMRQINAGFGALVRVIYGDRENAAEHDSVINSLCDEIVADARISCDNDENRHQFRIRCNASVQVVCSILKDWAFKAEQEWRGIVVSSAGQRAFLNVRQGKSTLVPYYDLSIADEARFANRTPLTEVLVGPTPHPELAKQATITALSLHGEVVPVHNTAVPFRNW